jgi:hypothetical protein
MLANIFMNVRTAKHCSNRRAEIVAHRSKKIGDVAPELTINYHDKNKSYLTVNQIA